MKLRLDEDLDGDDPLLSLVNLIDVFLVIIAALLLAVANNPANLLGEDKVTIIKNAGRSNMEIIIKDGAKIERFQAAQESGGGGGVKAGTAYRLADGSMVYVPE